MNETPADVPTIGPNPAAGHSPRLGELSALGAEALLNVLDRALPAPGNGQVPVAAFNSSI